MSFGPFVGRIARDQSKINLIFTRGYRMVDDQTIREPVPDFDYFIADGDHFVRVSDHGVLHPIRIGRIGAAISLQIINPDLARRKVGAVNDQPIVLAREGERRTKQGRAAPKQN